MEDFETFVVRREREKKTVYMREWRKRNPTSNRDTLRRFRERNPDYIKDYVAGFHAANPHKRAEYRRTYRENHSEFVRLSKPLYNRLHKVLSGHTKEGRTKELVGCSAAELRAHVESLFTKGMSWENYGEWHIDHKIGVSKFDLSDEDQQRKCFHFTNLQPLWAEDNLRRRRRP